MTRAANLPYCAVIFRAKTALAIGKHVANHPDAVPHVIERHQAQIEHHHAVVEAEVVAPVAGIRSTKRTMS